MSGISNTTDSGKPPRSPMVTAATCDAVLPRGRGAGAGPCSTGAGAAAAAAVQQ